MKKSVTAPHAALRVTQGSTKWLKGVAVAVLFVTTTLVAQLRVPDAEQFVGRPQGAPLTGDQLFRRTNEVSALLRCPVCQGLSVADSPSEMAVNMKGQVRQLLARGYTEEQILEYFERSYGQFVRLKPTFQGINALVWVIPVIALLIGVAIVVVAIRKLARVPAAAAPAADDEYLNRVRELVGGGKS